MSITTRKTPAERREARNQAMERYEKDRRRNALAKPGVHEFVIVLDHLKASFNVPKIFRSAEAFGAMEVALINIDRFDPAPAKGSFRKVPAQFYDAFGPCHDDLAARGYTLFTLEPNADAMLFDVALPRKSAFILGHEEMGISFDRSEYPAIQCVGVPQFGQVESLNVSIAASVVMYEYVRQMHSCGSGSRGRR